MADYDYYGINDPVDSTYTAPPPRPDPLAMRPMTLQEWQALNAAALHGATSGGTTGSRGGTAGGRPAVDYGSMINQLNQTVQQIGRLSQGGINTGAGGGSSSAGTYDPVTQMTAAQAASNALGQAQLNQSGEQFSANMARLLGNDATANAVAQGNLTLDTFRLMLQASGMDADNAFRTAQLGQQGDIAAANLGLQATDLQQRGYFQALNAALQGDALALDQWKAVQANNNALNQFNLQAYQAQIGATLDVRRAQLQEQLGIANIGIAEQDMELKRQLGNGNLALGAAQVQATIERLGLDRYNVDVQAAIDRERNDIQRMVASAQSEAARAQAQAEMARVEATLKSIELQRELGYGDLALGQKKAEDALRLGLDQLMVQREGQGIERQLGQAGIETQRYGINTSAATQLALGNLDAQTRLLLGNQDTMARYQQAIMDNETRLKLGGMDAETAREVAGLQANTSLQLGQLSSATSRYGVDVGAVLAREQSQLTAQQQAADLRMRELQLLADLSGKPSDWFKYQAVLRGMQNGVPGGMAALAGGAEPAALQGLTGPTTPQSLETFLGNTGLSLPQVPQFRPGQLPQFQAPNLQPYQMAPVNVPQLNVPPPPSNPTTTFTAPPPATIPPNQAPTFPWEQGGMPATTAATLLPPAAPGQAPGYQAPPPAAPGMSPDQQWAQWAQWMAQQQAAAQPQPPAPAPTPSPVPAPSPNPTPTPASATQPPPFNSMDALIEDAFIRGKLAEQGVDLGGVAYSGEGMRALAARYGIQVPQTASAQAGPPQAPPTAAVSPAAAMPPGAAAPPPPTFQSPSPATMVAGSASGLTGPVASAISSAPGGGATAAPSGPASPATLGASDSDWARFAALLAQLGMSPPLSPSSALPPGGFTSNWPPLQLPPPPTWQGGTGVPPPPGSSVGTIQPPTFTWPNFNFGSGAGGATPPTTAPTGSMAAMLAAAMQGMNFTGQLPSVPLPAPGQTAPPPVAGAPTPVAGAPASAAIYPTPTVAGSMVTVPARTQEQQIELLTQLFGPAAAAAYEEWQRNPTVDPMSLPSVQAVNRAYQESIGSFAPDNPNGDFLRYFRNAPVSYEAPRPGTATGQYVNTMATSPDNTRINNLIANYNYLSTTLQNMGGAAAGQLGMSGPPDTNASFAPPQQGVSTSPNAVAPNGSTGANAGTSSIGAYANAMTGGGSFTAGGGAGSGMPAGGYPLAGGGTYNPYGPYAGNTGVSTSPNAVAPNGLPAGTTSSPYPVNVGYPYLGAAETGTRRVPQTGLALVHEGEAIIPAQQNPYNDPSAQGAYGALGPVSPSAQQPLGSPTTLDSTLAPQTQNPVQPQPGASRETMPTTAPTGDYQGADTYVSPPANQVDDYSNFDSYDPAFWDYMQAQMGASPAASPTPVDLDALFPQFAGWVNATRAAGAEPSTLFPQFDWGGANPQQWATYTPQQKASALFVTGALPLEQAIAYGATDMLGNPLRAVASGFPDTGTSNGYLYGTPDTVSAGLANLGYSDTAANRAWFQQQGIALARTPAPPTGGFTSPPPATTPTAPGVSVPGSWQNGTWVEGPSPDIVPPSSTPATGTVTMPGTVPPIAANNGAVNDWLNQLANPNQVPWRIWNALYPSEQQFALGAWQAKGMYGPDVEAMLQRGRPTDVSFRSPYAAVLR